ncbi:hypothetical protein T492DRAFT_1093517 [Pavlovales sp. CCMP2436]|nr:hypothetical protein T492DRAFT_1093517 [Pavlovales sp. CCMP2436]
MRAAASTSARSVAMSSSWRSCSSTPGAPAASALPTRSSSNPRQSVSTAPWMSASKDLRSGRNRPATVPVGFAAICACTLSSCARSASRTGAAIAAGASLPERRSSPSATACIAQSTSCCGVRAPSSPAV